MTDLPPNPWLPLIAAADLPFGEPTRFDLRGHSVVAVRTEAGPVVMENRCPHQDKPLDGAVVDTGALVCPHHGWRFELQTEFDAAAFDPARQPLRHETRVVNDQIEVRFREQPESNGAGSDAATADDPSIRRYLVRYGRLGWVQVFGSLEPVPIQHRQRVLVRTDRGVEVGELLAPGTGSPTGELLGPLGEDDEQTKTDHAATVLRKLDDPATAPPVTVIDAECLYDEQTVVLYYLGEPDLDLGPLAIRLAEDLPIRVQFTPAIDPPPKSGGCGSGGCGCG